MLQTGDGGFRLTGEVWLASERRRRLDLVSRCGAGRRRESVGDDWDRRDRQLAGVLDWVLTVLSRSLAVFAAPLRCDAPPPSGLSVKAPETTASSTELDKFRKTFYNFATRDQIDGEV